MPEEFYALKQLQQQQSVHDDSQLNAIDETRCSSSSNSSQLVGQVAAAPTDHKLQLKKLKFRREMHALALEGGDGARGYCSCDEQWTNSSSPTSTTTSATMSPTLPNGNANASGSGNSGNGNGIVKMAALKQRNANANAKPNGSGSGSGSRLKQQHHVRFSDEKNFSD
ncbi:maker213 [Drosophila busckii]|uniref:Maker213 n=1 Tax=Drosophila busckii TaxID=30019 RepID=A0A0M4ER21_DROBS|nr:maker213 [Drosophila busckii]